MLRVRISINFTDIVDTQVVRVKGGTKPDDINTYEFMDGRTIRHRYGDGAVKLAMKILRRTANPPMRQERRG